MDELTLETIRGLLVNQVETNATLSSGLATMRNEIGAVKDSIDRLDGTVGDMQAAVTTNAEMTKKVLEVLESIGENSGRA